MRTDPVADVVLNDEITTERACNMCSESSAPFTGPRPVNLTDLLAWRTGHGHGPFSATAIFILRIVRPRIFESTL